MRDRDKTSEVDPGLFSNTEVQKRKHPGFVSPHDDFPRDIHYFLYPNLKVKAS